MVEQHDHDTGDQDEHHAAVPTGKVLDPVCGMTIAPEDAVDSAEHNGRTYYFCSPGCAEWFRKDPDEYTDPQRIDERKNVLMLHHLREREQAPDQDSHDAAPPVAHVRDPVCDMVVDPNDAAESIQYEGRTYYFCRRECADRFKRNPDVYADREGGGRRGGAG